MEEAGKGWLMIRRDVSGWMFLLIPAHPGICGQRALKLVVVVSSSLSIRIAEQRAHAMEELLVLSVGSHM